MEQKNVKKVVRRKLRGEVRGFLFALFLMWMVIGGVVISKVTVPSIESFILKDNYVFAMEHGNPSNWEEKDEAFAEYNEHSNKLINSDDKIISTFFQQNGLVKVIIIILAFVPYLITIAFIGSIISEFSKRTKKQLARH